MALQNKELKILIGCTGSVATIKLPKLTQSILNVGPNIKVQIVVTENARKFFDTKDLPANVPVHCDADEWSSWKDRGDPILHIELVKWADYYLIAPLDANTMGKLANGICDNLVTCCARAWQLKNNKLLMVCPAMNTHMWEHPITQEHIKKFQSWGYYVFECVQKTLMCGDTGMGAMAEVETIVEYLSHIYKKNYSS